MGLSLLGVVLAGGNGSRLGPTTLAVNKHLLPVYSKPLFYYPLSVALLSGCTDLRIVVTPDSRPLFERHLGSLRPYGIAIDLVEQPQSLGIADGLGRALESDKNHDGTLLLLGDNITYGPGVGRQLRAAWEGNTENATCFITEVKDPERFGVLTVGDDGRAQKIEEKPKNPESDLAIVGTYFFPKDVVGKILGIRASERGELEVTDLLRLYLDEARLETVRLPRGTAWLDTGTSPSLLEASNYVRIIEERQGQLVGSPHEVALRTGLITEKEFIKNLESEPQSEYFNQLRLLVSGSSST